MSNYDIGSSAKGTATNDEEANQVRRRSHVPPGVPKKQLDSKPNLSRYQTCVAIRRRASESRQHNQKVLHRKPSSDDGILAPYIDREVEKVFTPKPLIMDMETCHRRLQDLGINYDIKENYTEQDISDITLQIENRVRVMFDELVVSQQEVLHFEIQLNRDFFHTGVTIRKNGRYNVEPDFLSRLRRTIQEKLGVYINLGLRLSEIEELQALHSFIGGTSSERFCDPFIGDRISDVEKNHEAKNTSMLTTLGKGGVANNTQVVSRQKASLASQVNSVDIDDANTVLTNGVSRGRVKNPKALNSMPEFVPQPASPSNVGNSSKRLLHRGRQIMNSQLLQETQ